MNVLDEYKYASFDNQTKAFLNFSIIKFQVKYGYILVKDSNDIERAKLSSIFSPISRTELVVISIL